MPHLTATMSVKKAREHMEDKANQYKELVQLAYDSVKDLKVEDEYKLAGYKVLLENLLGAPTQSVITATETGATSATFDTTDWQKQIASRLGIEPSEVAEIYHQTEEGMIELIIEAKDLPSTNSKSTVDIAALLAAGRQAAGLEKATPIDDIRKAAEHYRVYDNKNFARTLRQLGSKFRNDNSTIELTNGAYKITADIARKYAGSNK